MHFIDWVWPDIASSGIISLRMSHNLQENKFNSKPHLQEDKPHPLKSQRLTSTALSVMVDSNKAFLNSNVDNCQKSCILISESDLLIQDFLLAVHTNNNLLDFTVCSTATYNILGQK